MRSAGCVIGSVVPLVTSSRPAEVNVTMPTGGKGLSRSPARA